MKCFLHIGTEKTGTTTIQNYFDINRSQLLESGFIYPATTGKTNHFKLAIAAYNQERLDELTRGIGIQTCDNLLRWQKKTVNKLKNEVDSIKKRHRNVKAIVFSSEHLQSRLQNSEEILSLKEILDKLEIDEVRIIMYLRRPAEIANSLYSTAVISGASALAPPMPEDPYWNNICNHKNTIERFSSVFGESAIIPRLFARDELTNNSVLDDITNIIGIPVGDYTIPDRQNERLSTTGIRILKKINEKIPLSIDGKPNTTRSKLVSEIQKNFSDNKYIMPRHLYEAYDSEFLSSNEWVRRKFFPEKKNLFPVDIPLEENVIISNREIENIATLIVSIWQSKNEHSLHRPPLFTTCLVLPIKDLFLFLRKTAYEYYHGNNASGRAIRWVVKRAKNILTRRNKTIYVIDGNRKRPVLSSNLVSSCQNLQVAHGAAIQELSVGGWVPQKWSRDDFLNPKVNSWQEMRELIVSQIIGPGVEFGAGPNPSPIPLGTEIRYVEYHNLECKPEIFPDVNRKALVVPDIYDSLDKMTKLNDNSLNFIIASHVIEHTRSPLSVFERAYRKLCVGGMLILVVPDKTKTFDSLRAITTIEHLVADYETPSRERDVDHYFDFLKLAVRHKGNDHELITKAREMEAANRDIHFHVWDFDSFTQLVEYSRQKISPWSDVWKEPCIKADPTALEFYFVLTK